MGKSQNDTLPRAQPKGQCECAYPIAAQFVLTTMRHALTATRYVSIATRHATSLPIKDDTVHLNRDATHFNRDAARHVATKRKGSGALSAVS